MKIDDIEIGGKYAVTMWDRGRWRTVVATCVDTDDHGGIAFESAGRDWGVYERSIDRIEPYTEPPRRTIDELEAEEVEPSNGFECVWRVRCTSGDHSWSNSYLAEPLVLDDNYYNQKGERRIGTLGDAVHFKTESAALHAAEQAGWYVDAHQALCPECRDEMECLDEWGVDAEADSAMDLLTQDHLDDLRENSTYGGTITNREEEE